ncbi:MAG: hypothetical protein ACI4TX_01100 [Christensenellales bacterium]
MDAVLIKFNHLAGMIEKMLDLINHKYYQLFAGMIDTKNILDLINDRH